MTQRNLSSYLPIFYICVVLFCISIIHISEVINEQRHRQQIKAIDLAKKQQKPKKRRKKRTGEAKKKEANKIVTPTQASDTSKVETKSKPEKPARISDEEFFANLFEKQETQDGQKQNPRSRSDIVIRYYKKDKDGDRVYKLRNMGFYIHERPAEDDFEDYASNAIFYGDSVKKNDLIRIAYQLMQNGVRLQSMTLSKYHDAWKAHSVEIGTDTTVLKDKPITLSRLRKMWEDK
ncbi:hypothetical protein [Reichenbachiella sp.]|uniref:hypothetical protein n=1 Tax=Reichenbachiella sp. TaxID=2184521 RepID=UPI003B5C2086